MSLTLYLLCNWFEGEVCTCWRRGLSESPVELLDGPRQAQQLIEGCHKFALAAQHHEALCAGVQAMRAQQWGRLAYSLSP